MAKFSTKKLGKQIDKWTSGYYSSGYKSTNKSMSNSSFWINEDFLQDIPKGADYIRLAGYKRAISNFVRIVTGKDNIPVVYQATGNSYTDGKSVVISSKLDENQFDPTVGLALHEGSHIALSNFKVIHSDIAYVVENELSAWYTQTIGELKNYSDWCYHNRELLKDILNVIEDRRIDKFVYDSAPGYQGYYQSMYDTYFNAPIIDRALIDNLKISRSEEDYMFHIINFANPKRQLDCMPGLRDIWNTIDIKNISRLKSTNEALEVAQEVWKLLQLNIVKEDKQGNDDDDDSEVNEGTNQNPSGSGNGQGDDEDDNGNENGGSGAGGDDEDENGQAGVTIGKPLSQKESAALAKALEAQGNFLKGSIKKKGLTKADANKVNAASESNMSYAEVGGDVTAEDGNKFILGKTNCVVVKGITRALIDSDLLGGHCHNPEDQKERLQRYEDRDYVAQGIQLGILLGKRLKTRDEERTVKTLRLESGKMDRRLINELGFGNERVFSQVFHNTVTPSLVHVSIDASGSMYGDKWSSAMKTAIAIAKAGSMIASLDVVISVRGAIGRGGQTNPLMWIIYDSRTEKFNAVKDKFYAVQANGSTPEGLCYQAVMQDILKSANGKEAFFINVCDGEPCYSDSHVNGYSGYRACVHTKAQVNKMRQAGIKVLSFFVDRFTSEERTHETSSQKNHRDMYGKDATTINLDNLNQLSKSINSLFERNV